MTPKDASNLIVRIINAPLSKAQLRDIDTVMELIFAQGHDEPVKKQKVVDQPNDIKPEENTINLQDVDFFELPKEMNVQIEGEQTVHKIKIFPDGVSEEPTAEPPTAAVN